jgi:sugar O-acyltransferase (sialic acid O-acetyltransferase NeuD family)
MTNQFVIWGCAGHAKVIASLISSQGGEVTALFDNSEVTSILPDIPVYWGMPGFQTWLQLAGEVSNFTGVIAIGGSRGRDRIQIQNIFRNAGLNMQPLVHSAAYVCPTASLGDGTQVLAQAVVAADSIVGEACIINHKASVDHECILGSGIHLAPGATLCGCVQVGENTLIGAGSVILPRVNIGSNVIIGAGSVVTKDIPNDVVVFGNPARIARSLK